MSQPAFDPFGEPVPAARSTAGHARTSKWLHSGGIGLFWTFVGMIVLARAFFFEPSDLSFERAAAWARTLLASL